MLIAYFIEAGVLLIVVPWTQYWERNFFVELPALRPILLDPYLRGAISGIGGMTFLAGLIELGDLLLRRAESPSESAGVN